MLAKCSPAGDITLIRSQPEAGKDNTQLHETNVRTGEGGGYRHRITPKRKGHLMKNPNFL